jgi:hypothetical protein
MKKDRNKGYKEIKKQGKKLEKNNGKQIDGSGN